MGRNGPGHEEQQLRQQVLPLVRKFPGQLYKPISSGVYVVLSIPLEDIMGKQKPEDAMQRKYEQGTTLHPQDEGGSVPSMSR